MALAPAAIIVTDKEQIIQNYHVLEDADGLITDRYDATPGTCYLIRPDHHVAARWRRLDLPRLRKHWLLQRQT